jgi:hypothetical protein
MERQRLRVGAEYRLSTEGHNNHDPNKERRWFSAGWFESREGPGGRLVPGDEAEQTTQRIWALDPPEGCQADFMLSLLPPRQQDGGSGGASSLFGSLVSTPLANNATEDAFKSALRSLLSQAMLPGDSSSSEGLAALERGLMVVRRRRDGDGDDDGSPDSPGTEFVVRIERGGLQGGDLTLAVRNSRSYPVRRADGDYAAKLVEQTTLLPNGNETTEVVLDDPEKKCFGVSGLVRADAPRRQHIDTAKPLTVLNALPFSIYELRYVVETLGAGDGGKAVGASSSGVESDSTQQTQTRALGRLPGAVTGVSTAPPAARRLADRYTPFKSASLPDGDYPEPPGQVRFET